MSEESSALLSAFWSWADGITGVVTLGLLMPIVLGASLGLLPLLIVRRDWRVLPALLVSAISVGASGAWAFSMVGAGAPRLDFWLMLTAQLFFLTLPIAVLFMGRLSLQRIRRDRESIESVRSFRQDSTEVGEAQRPAPRNRLSALEAEYYVAEWIRWMGATDAVVTRERRDGGVDVRTGHYVVQVKHRPEDFVSVDVVRALHGVASSEGRAGMVFASGRFSTDALGFAAKAGVGLFIFRPKEGRIVPANTVAHRLQHEGLRAATLQTV